MYDAKDILKGARTIRSHLTELLEASQAAEMDENLAELLAEFETGSKVDSQILKLIAKHEATRTWMAAFLEHHLPPQLARFYSPPPGNTGPIPGVMRYVCPEGDYHWFRHRVGEPIPQCPIHQLDLVPSSSGQT